MGNPRFRVLGPVEVFRDGQPVALGAGKKLALLAGLLVSANRLVAAEMLVDFMWEAGTPVHPRAALQTGMSRLRRLLGQDVVVSVAGGYLIRVAADDLDLLKFGELVQAADAYAADGAGEAALAALEEALGLWRDPVMGNVTSTMLHRDVVPKLTDRFLDAQERRAQLCLRLGLHESLTADLAELTRAFPFRERLTGNLMLALYRSDRQADALATYEKLRRSLGEELGIDPAAEIQGLYLRILRGDPGLHLADDEARGLAQLTSSVDAGSGGAAGTAGGGVVPRQLPADIAYFIGREDELSAVRDVLTGDGPAGTRIAMVAGPGGAGKTAVAVRAAHGLADLYPDGQLYVNLQGASARPARPGEVLSRFLRGFGVAGPAIPADADERSALYRSVVADRRVLVVLDDAADERQLRPLLPAGEHCGVIVTSRARITGLPGGHPVQLGMLDDGEAVLLLGLIAGSCRIHRELADAHAIARMCGGLPLALRIAGARLAARPHWQLASLADRLEDGRRRLSELSHGDLDVRASLALSYQGLAPAAQLLLRRIGLLGAPDFPAWAAAALLGVSVKEAGELIDCLVNAQLLVVAAHPAIGGPRFRCHDLTRDFARDLALGDDEVASRAALVRVFGALLGLAEQAHRSAYGGDYSILHGTAPRWRAADMDPAHVIGEAPMAWLEGEHLFIVAAVCQAAEAGMDELCWDLAWTAVTLFEAANYLDDWRTVQEQALAVTRRAGNRRGEAAMLASLGACMMVQQSYEAGRDLCEQAARLFTEIGDQHGHGLAQRTLALADRHAGRLDCAIARGETARNAMSMAGDRLMEAGILRDMAIIYLERDDLDLARRCLAQALPISQDIASTRMQAMVLHQLGELHMRQGQSDEAEQAFSQALRFATASNDRLGQVYTQLGLADTWLSRGRCDLAEPLLRDVLDSARQLGHRHAEAHVLLVLGKTQARRADHAAATRSVLASIDICQAYGIPLSQASALDALAAIYLATGQHDAAEHAGRQANTIRAAAAASPAKMG